MSCFAFVVHPASLSEFGRMYRFPRYLPDSVSAWVARYAPPLVTSPVKGIVSQHSGATSDGWVVGCPLTSEQLLELPVEVVMNRIVRAGRLAQKRGAQILGLGGLTSAVGDAGLTVAGHLDIPVTTGRSYTVAAAITATREAARLMGMDVGSAEVLVLEAAETAGRVVAELVARETRLLTLAGRDASKLRMVADHIRHKLGLAPSITTDMRRASARADIIFAGSVGSPGLKAADLKPGSIVCDIDGGSGLTHRVGSWRDDVAILRGGFVRLPGATDFALDSGPRGMVPPSMAETAVLALEDRLEEFSLGNRLSVQKVDEINRMADKHGFRLGCISGAMDRLTPAAFERIRWAAHR